MLTDIFGIRAMQFTFLTVLVHYALHIIWCFLYFWLYFG